MNEGNVEELCNRWNDYNIEAHSQTWFILRRHGFSSTICSVGGCCRDNLAFMWVHSGRLDLDWQGRMVFGEEGIA